MKLIFFGSDAFAVPSLQAIVGSKHKILAVATQPDRPAGRGQKLTPAPVAVVAKEMGLPLIQPAKLKEAEATAEIKKLKPDILVVVAYGQFLPLSLIEACPRKAVNLHPSLLPKYRGAAPMQWALLNGDKKTGVTTMTVSKEMDAGDIYLQCETNIDEAENFEALQHSLAELGADLLLKTLDGIEKGELKPKPQDSSKVILAPKLSKEDGHLNFKEPAEKLYNKVKALNPWPGTFCRLDEKILKILEAGPVNMESQKPPGSVIEKEDGLIVACGQKALCLLEVQLEGKKRMSIKDFLKGHPIELGAQLK